MCKCKKNGETNFQSINLVPTATPSATSQEYMLDLVHYLCGNRKVCINGSYPLQGVLNCTVDGSPVSVGNNAYAVTVNVTGSVNYKPYVQGCCDVCPKQDFVGLKLTIPVYSATGVPTVTLSTAGSVVYTTAIATQDCCSITNEVRMLTSLIVTTTPPAAA
jgi:hypothetical protein